MRKLTETIICIIVAIVTILVLRGCLYQDKIDHCNSRQENDDINCEYLYAERE